MDPNKLKTIIPLLFLILCSCSDNGQPITDHYRFYKQVEFDYNGNRVDARNVLMCKLASDNDPFIKGVLSIQWNSSAIIAKTKQGYYVVESNSYGLCCSCGNSTSGPLNQKEFQEYIQESSFSPEHKMNTKH